MPYPALYSNKVENMHAPVFKAGGGVFTKVFVKLHFS